jgi:hypothetical protein
MEINYSFHIGQRCQSLAFLQSNNFLTGYNLFAGSYISFKSTINIIKNNFKDFENHIVKFNISELKNEDDNIKFVRCHDYSHEKILEYKTLLKSNDFNFFFKKNYYYNANYCINLKYTDIENFIINDLFYWKNNYLVLPNSDYSSDEQIDTFNRIKERFKNCLENNNPEKILLIFMDTLIIDSDIEKKINDVIDTYTLQYNLFYIIPIYNENENEKNMNNEKITKINNITFYTIYFPSLEIQKINNPNDDNPLSFVENYNNIKNKLSECYNLNLINTDN